MLLLIKSYQTPLFMILNKVNILTIFFQKCQKILSIFGENSSVPLFITTAPFLRCSVNFRPMSISRGWITPYVFS